MGLKREMLERQADLAGMVRQEMVLLQVEGRRLPILPPSY